MKKLITIYVISLLNILHVYAQETITINIGSINSSDSINKPHMLGVIAGPAPNFNSIAPDLTTKFQDIGVTTIRNNDYKDDRLDMERMFFCGNYPITLATPQYPNWDSIPNNSNYFHFTESDVQFQNWLDGGFLPFFRLGGEHSSFPRGHDYEGPRLNEEANWIQAGIKVVNRYNSFDSCSNTLAGYLDIWTEYPQYQFWDRDSLAFNNFWCNNFDSLKNNFPSLKIGGPGFNTSVSTKLGNNSIVKTWIDLFLRELKTRNLKPDWIGFHVFSNTIDDFYNAAINYRKLLRAEPPFNSYASVWGTGDSSFFHGTELICDAWGFDNDSTLPDSFRDSLFNKQRGAAHHVGAFIAFQQTDIERAYLYRGGEADQDTTTAVMGLFYGNANGSYKPVAYGFKLCSKMQTVFNKKLISPVDTIASGGSKIWTLAGEDISGNKAILISNPTANTINLSLQLNGSNLSTSMYPYINQYTVTDNNNGQTPSIWTSGIFVLPPYTSHLITMSNTPLSIVEQHNIKQNITLYPNPTNNIINFSETLKDIKVYNVYGQFVLSQIGATNTLSVKGLSDGVYFIHTINATFKFIVNK